MFSREQIEKCVMSDEEIKNDIEITLREIEDNEAEAEALSATPLSSRDAKWNHMRAESRRSTNKERIQFIEDLKSILMYRSLKNVP